MSKAPKTLLLWELLTIYNHINWESLLLILKIKGFILTYCMKKSRLPTNYNSYYTVTITFKLTMASVVTFARYLTTSVFSGRLNTLFAFTYVALFFYIINKIYLSYPSRAPPPVFLFHSTKMKTQEV